MAAKPRKTPAVIEIAPGEFVVEPIVKLPAEKTPKPAPGAPGFDWQSEYPDEKVYVYTASNGTTVGIAAMVGARKPKSGFLRQLRKEAAMEQMWTILELVMSPAALDVSDEFEDEDYGAMYAGWSEWSKTAVGESTR